MFTTRSFPPVDTQTHINWGTLVSGWRLLRWINSRLGEASSMTAALSAGLTDRTGVGITDGWNYTVSLSRTGKPFIPLMAGLWDQLEPSLNRLKVHLKPAEPDISATAAHRFRVLAGILFRSTHENSFLKAKYSSLFVCLFYIWVLCVTHETPVANL